MEEQEIRNNERTRVCKLIEDTLFDMSEKKRGYVSMPLIKIELWQEIKDGVQ